jgi:hypothetical protein
VFYASVMPAEAGKRAEMGLVSPARTTLSRRCVAPGEQLLCIQSGETLKNPAHWRFDTTGVDSIIDGAYAICTYNVSQNDTVQAGRRLRHRLPRDGLCERLEAQTRLRVRERPD